MQTRPPGHRTTTGATLLVAVLAAAVLGACGGGADGRVSDSSPSQPATSLDATPVATASPDDPSPLEAAFGGPDAIADTRARATQWKQDHLATCMAADGWEYVPYVLSTRSVRFDYQVEKWQTLIGDATARERWGYGIATRFRPDGSTYDAEGATLSETPIEPDPNEAIAAALSMDQQRERATAQFGSASAGTAGDVRGCTAEVDEAFAAEFPAFEQMNRLQDDIAKKTASAADMAAAIDEWFACMRAEGFDVDDPINPGGSIDAAVADLLPGGRPAADFASGIATLQERELTMAATDWTCRTTTMNPLFAGARHEVESEFLERAGDLVRRVKAEGP